MDINPKKKWDQWMAWGAKRFNLTPVEVRICATGVVIVGLSTLLFLALNLNALLLALFLALSLGFAVISFISGIALLQEETILTICPVSLPFDIKTHNLPEMASDPTETNGLALLPRTAITHLALASPPPMTLKQKIVRKQGRVIRLKKDTILTSCGELLQYEIFRLLHALQQGLWLSSKPRRTPKEGAGAGTEETEASGNANKPADKTQAVTPEEQEDTDMEILPKSLVGYPRLSKVCQYQGDPLWNIVSVNRFSVVESERALWKRAHLFLPENTRPTLNYVVASPESDNLGYNVQLVKPWFFEIRFTVVPTTPTEWHIPPASVELSDEESLIAVKYMIRMKAHFYRMTAGNQQTDELKVWARWLFARMKQLLKDRDFESWIEQEQKRMAAEKASATDPAADFNTAPSDSDHGTLTDSPDAARPPNQETLASEIAQPAPTS